MYEKLSSVETLVLDGVVTEVRQDSVVINKLEYFLCCYAEKNHSMIRYVSLN